jgi:hypothetical protein
MSGLWIEIGIADASVDATVPYTDIGQAGGVVGSNRIITHQVNHEIIDAAVPA